MKNATTNGLVKITVDFGGGIKKHLQTPFTMKQFEKLPTRKRDEMFTEAREKLTEVYAEVS